jgi:hypothetical protein
MVYVIQVCWQLVSRRICSCSQAVSKPLWYIPLLCVQWKTSDDGQRNCSKHVEFHSKNKFEKLVHLVGFIIRNLSRCTVTWTSNTLFPIIFRDDFRRNIVETPYSTFHTTIAYSAWKWLTKPKHVADDKLLIKLCLDFFTVLLTFWHRSFTFRF